MHLLACLGPALALADPARDNDHWTAAQLATGVGNAFNVTSTVDLCMYAIVGYDRQEGRKTELLYAINSTHAKSLGIVYHELKDYAKITDEEQVFGVDFSAQQLARATKLCNQITDAQLASLLLQISDDDYVLEKLGREKPREKPEEKHSEL